MTEAMKLETTDEALRNALAWYGEQARLARLIHSEGDPGRWALAEDGGKRAREVLALSSSPAGVGVETRKNGHVVGWATVRVEDTCDGLLINADDMKRFGLREDVQYEGHFLPDGRYRIAIRAALTKEGEQ